MTNALPLSSRIYGRLLCLYPEDLRRDYGADMTLVFAENLEAARREAGLRGVIRVWRCALGEFLHFALPVCASRPAVRVSAVWFALSSAIMTVEMTMELCHAAPVMKPLDAICAALLLPTLTTPFMFLAIVWVCRGDNVISLGLCNNSGQER